MKNQKILMFVFVLALILVLSGCGKEIDSSAWEDASAPSLHTASPEEWFTWDDGDYISAVTGEGQNAEELVVPSRCKGICPDAFSYNTYLVSVSFEGGELTSIGEYAFAYNSALKSVSLPEGLLSIGANAFCGCDSLEEIRFPESLTSIEDGLLGLSTDGLTVYVVKGSWADTNREQWDPAGYADVVTE